MKKIPMRTCIVTKEKLSKYDLIRVVKDKDGNVCVDPSGKLNGRGVYLKKDKAVIKKAQTKQILDRALEISIPLNIYEELNELVGSDMNE